MSEITKRDDAAVALERVMVAGDLAQLTAEQRTAFYMRTCESLGLNPYTKPFEYIKLNGKLVLYAKRDCTDQLRKINGVSIEIIDRKLTDGMLSVHARATDKTGRTDEDFGVVATAGKLQGEAGANLVMKAVTKAKRRVTLSICGLGMLDETEVETIPGAQIVPHEDCPKPAKQIAPQAAPQKSPAELLRHLEEEFGCCGDMQVLQETWDSYEAQIDKLDRSRRAIAEGHFERRQRDLEKEAA